MDTTTNYTQIQTLVEEKRKIHNIAMEHYEQYKKHMREAQRIEAEIEKTCRHTWIRDRANYGEQTEYICQHCGSSN